MQFGRGKLDETEHVSIVLNEKKKTESRRSSGDTMDTRVTGIQEDSGGFWRILKGYRVTEILEDLGGFWENLDISRVF